MSKARLDVIVDGLTFPESPRWHDDRLWFSDFYSGDVAAVRPGGSPETLVNLPGDPSGIAWLPDGRPVIAEMQRRRLVRLEPDGTLVEHADLSSLAAGVVNDLVADDEGRVYVGEYGFDILGGARVATARMLLVTADGRAEVVADGLLLPNGPVITPDGSTLLVAETLGQRVSAFQIRDDGSLSERRDWARFGRPATVGDDPFPYMADAAIAPDGMCLDDEGAVWVADAAGNRVVRISDGGEIVGEISTGEIGAFACALGGSDRRSLYICVSPAVDPDECRRLRGGKVLECRVDVPGAGWS